MPDPKITFTPVKCWFIRHRQTLLATVSMSDLFAEYERHKASHHIQIEPQQERLFFQAMAAFVLHCASQPRFQHISWTINFQDPLINLFLVGDTGEGTVAGRIFTENVKVSDQNAFYQEIIRGDKPVQRSHVPFNGNDLLQAVEHYYEMSEQRPARFFQASASEFAIISAHPDYDEGWFTHLNEAVLAGVWDKETVNLIETRYFHWACGCNQEKVLQVLSVATTGDIDELYQGEEVVQVNCPRCMARHNITRETMEAWLDEQKNKKN